jgi:hypothetical protein
MSFVFIHKSKLVTSKKKAAIIGKHLDVYCMIFLLVCIGAIDHDRMVVGFTTTFATSSYHH